MEWELTKTFIGQGIFCALFIGLLAYVLKQNRERERELIGALGKLTDLYEKLSLDVTAIKEILKKLNGRRK